MDRRIALRRLGASAVCASLTAVVRSARADEALAASKAMGRRNLRIRVFE
jgi:hypothetical protein